MSKPVHCKINYQFKVSRIFEVKKNFDYDKGLKCSALDFPRFNDQYNTLVTRQIISRYKVWHVNDNNNDVKQMMGNDFFANQMMLPSLRSIWIYIPWTSRIQAWIVQWSIKKHGLASKPKHQFQRQLDIFYLLSHFCPHVWYWRL